MRLWIIGIIVLIGFSFTSSKTEVGKATYYANAFQGRKTSSGEKFDQTLLTAAHKTLPFGTLVQVKNMNNDSVIIVKINDRLPQRSGCIIDLSLAAAKHLNFVRQGVTKVELTVHNQTEE